MKIATAIAALALVSALAGDGGTGIVRRGKSDIEQRIINNGIAGG